MDLASQLADPLRRLQQRVGLTQTQMARRLGNGQPILNRLENAAQNSTLKTLKALCRALKCGVGELFEGDIRLRRRSPTGKRRR